MRLLDRKVKADEGVLDRSVLVGLGGMLGLEEEENLLR